MNLSVFSDSHFMKEALKEAQKAFDNDEVPVGAVVVCNNQIIARSHNLTEKLTDCTAHAEMLVLTSASNYLGAKYLTNCTIYITLEPCNMCAGALYWSKIGKVVYGAADEKRGYSLNNKNLLHPKTKVELGLLANECSELLLQFFKTKRK